MAVIAPTDCNPLVASLPDQDPDATHAVAFVELQTSVELPPLVTEFGLAVRVTVGTGALAVTVVDCAAVPPVPVQVSVYLVDAVSAPVLCEPLVASLPLHPFEAMHEVAFVADQVKVELPPLVTVLGFAVSTTAGAGIATVTAVDCALVPPAPAHVNV